MNLPKPTAAIAPTLHGVLAETSSTTTAVVFTPTPMLNLTAAHLARSAQPPSQWPSKISPPPPILNSNNNQISDLQKFANDLKMAKLARKRMAYKNRTATMPDASSSSSSMVIPKNPSTMPQNLPPSHLVVKTSKLNVNAPVFVPKTTTAGAGEGQTTSKTCVVAAPVSCQPSLGGIRINESRTIFAPVKKEVFDARDIAFPPDLEDGKKTFDNSLSPVAQVTSRPAASQSASSSTSQSFDEVPFTGVVPPQKIALVQNWNLTYNPKELEAAPETLCKELEDEPTFTVASMECLRRYDKEQMFDVYRMLKDMGGVPRPSCLSTEFDNEVGIFQPCKWIENEWRKDAAHAKQNFLPLINANKDQNPKDDFDGRISQNGLRRALVNDQVSRLIKKGMTNFVSRQLVSAMTDQMKLNQ